MKIIALLLILSSCNPKKTNGYVTGAWYCESYTGGAVHDCTHIMTGKKEDVIYDPTFVIPVEENEAK
jgi:hypothetical protein